MTRGNHYQVLGVEAGASIDQIEKAYRYLVDLYADDSLATYSLLDPGELRQVRAQLREAYDVLRDPLRRLEYDVRQGVMTSPSGEAPANLEAREPAEPEPTVVEPPATPPPPAMRSQRAPRGEPVALPKPVTGPALKAFREEQGVSLREIADTTKISLRYLEYIECDRHDFLPAEVYLRGFLQEYAKIVGLDWRQTADAYLAYARIQRGED
jgi:flagellar biosynthesis protein FlhG